MPNPEPKSGNCDVVRVWNDNPNNFVEKQVSETVSENQTSHQNGEVLNISTSNEVEPQQGPSITPLPTQQSTPIIEPVPPITTGPAISPINSDIQPQQPNIDVLDINDIVNAPDSDDFIDE